VATQQRAAVAFDLCKRFYYYSLHLTLERLKLAQQLPPPPLAAAAAPRDAGLAAAAAAAAAGEQEGVAGNAAAAAGWEAEDAKVVRGLGLLGFGVRV